MEKIKNQRNKVKKNKDKLLKKNQLSKERSSIEIKNKLIHVLS